MNPSVWGPSFWFVLHTVSLNYPDNPSYAERRTHYDFYHIVRNILPCEMCRQHYRELIKQYPIQPFLDSKSSLVSWVIMIHNQVNKRLGKPLVERSDMLSTYQQVYERKSFCDPACPTPTPNIASTDEGGNTTNESEVSTKRSTGGINRSLVWVCIVQMVFIIIFVLYIAWRIRREYTSS